MPKKLWVMRGVLLSCRVDKGGHMGILRLLLVAATGAQFLTEVMRPILG